MASPECRICPAFYPIRVGSGQGIDVREAIRPGIFFRRTGESFRAGSICIGMVRTRHVMTPTAFCWTSRSLMRKGILS